MRVTEELLYDSETTLRLVDRALEELAMTDPIRSAAAGVPGYRTEQLRGASSDPGDPSTHFVRAYWEIHDALERVREGHAELAPPAPAGDPRDRLDRALAMVDELQDEAPVPAHEALREELLAMAEHLRSSEAVTDRLQRTADLLLDLEVRLADLARVFDAPPEG